MKPTWSHMAVVLSAGLLIAATLACAGGAGSSTPTSAPASTSSSSTTGGGSIQDIGDPCKLLVQADADKLFGHPANPGKSNFGSNSASCTYTSGSGDILAVNVLYEDQAAKDSNDYTSVRTSDTQPVAGLGDDAYYNKAFWLLTVAKGHWMVSVNANLGGTNQALDKLTPLAQLALQRLP